MGMLLIEMNGDERARILPRRINRRGEALSLTTLLAVTIVLVIAKVPSITLHAVALFWKP